MTKEYQERLTRLGIDSNRPITVVFDNLLNLTEYLYKRLEEDEFDRFEKEIERIKKPTN